METMPMSKLPEPDFLKQILTSLSTRDRPFRIAIVGIGHELRGDDAAGIAVARALEPLAASQERLLVIDAGSVPESFVGVLRRFDTDLTLLVDAAQLDAEPGTMRWVAWQKITGISASTHSLPLYIFVHYLVTELNCEVALLGIQPSQTTVGEPLSPVIQESVGKVVHMFTNLVHAI
jgi:hydrogenase 3 maturation protease